VTEPSGTRFIRHTFETPVGPMAALAADSPEAPLVALEFVIPSRSSRLQARLGRWHAGGAVVDGTNAGIDRVSAWLEAYFAGTSADISGLPLAPCGATFERRVWDALLQIPAGETASYGEIARRIGSPGAARAVGLANGANPIAIVVPCHRVIGANGRLTGYGGGLDRKAWLLNHERRWRNALPLWLTDDLRPPASASVHPNGG
jgi:O-6-methylguanine DNA methyltransferase